MTYTLYPAKRTPVCQLKITCSIWSAVTWAHAPVTLPSPVNSVSTKLLFGSSLELQCHQCHQFHLKIVTKWLSLHVGNMQKTWHFIETSCNPWRLNLLQSQLVPRRALTCQYKHHMSTRIMSLQMSVKALSKKSLKKCYCSVKASNKLRPQQRRC